MRTIARLRHTETLVAAVALSILAGCSALPDPCDTPLTTDGRFVEQGGLVVRAHGSMICFDVPDAEGLL